MKAFVIGGAGFVGSHLVDLLVERGDAVTVYDNLSMGKLEFIQPHIDSGKVRFVKADALDLAALITAMRGHDLVVHLAANPDARWSLERTRFDLEQGTIATHNALDAARVNGITKFMFSSSGTVYGNRSDACSEKDMNGLPISLYGASKLAGEAMINAYVEAFGFTAYVCRFGNVVGPRGTHGAILDFCRKLKAHPDYLDVLGDGTQAKPYLHVTDCAAGLLYVHDHAKERYNVYNLAPPDNTSVKRLAELCVQASPFPNAKIMFGQGQQGWRGDVPVCLFKPDKLAALGFRVRYTSDQASALAVREIAREVFGDAARA
jgi:UDP-glucose 4-epimerase